MSRAQLHPLHFFNYIQYAVVLCAVPVVQDLLGWDFAGAWADLWQGFAILAGCLVLTLVLWRTSRVALAGGVAAGGVAGRAGSGRAAACGEGEGERRDRGDHCAGPPPGVCGHG